MKIILIFYIYLVCASFSSLSAQIDSQWRGTDRDGKYHGEKLLKSWPKNGPNLLTTIDGLGEGYSSPSVTNDRIYITGLEDDTGFLHAFDLSGKPIWKKSYGDEWDDRYAGTRVTPTVVGNKIYFSNSLGQVFCFDDKGSQIWKFDMEEEYDAPNLRFGMTESILIDGDKLFCTPGAEDATIAVLNRHTGKVIKEIKGNGQSSAYCSPTIINHNGRRILVTILKQSLVGVDLKSLNMIFEYAFNTRRGINPNTPLYYNGYIYIVSGYGKGGELLKLSDDGTKVDRVWADSQLDSQMGSVILTDGYLYGSGHDNRDWYCIEFLTGNVKYSSRKLGRKGNIIFSDGMLYIYSEKGDVALVKPNPEKFEIISSFKLKEGSGEHWAHPVIRSGKLYVRHGDILNIYDIAG